MGLDMMLYKANKEVKEPEHHDFHEKEDYNKALHSFWDSLNEVGYWRKFNALHSWFVTECQDGVDECQYSNVSEDKLVELLRLLRESIESGDPLLQPVGGFYFGSTNIDAYYWSDVKAAFEKLDELYNNTDFENEQLIYHSSW